jgi:hypothetical protein
MKKSVCPFLVWIVVFLFVSSWPVVFSASWEEYKVSQLNLMSDTGDCANEKPNKNIELGLENAERLFIDGSVNVLIGPKDGCYLLNTKVQVYSIERTQKTRKIFRRHSWAPAFIEIIVEVPFEELSKDRQKYVLNKFGSEAKKISIREIVLSVEGKNRPNVMSEFPIQHPQAEQILQKNILAMKPSVDRLVIDPKRHRDVPTMAIIDPENSRYAIGFRNIFEGVNAKINTVIILSENQTDYRAYNVATALALSSRSLNVIIANKEILNVTSEIPNLKSVSCWEAWEMTKSGVTVGQISYPRDSQLWYGENEVDVSYATALGYTLNKSGIKSGWWFPGGSAQLKWCQKFYSERLYEQSNFD